LFLLGDEQMALIAPLALRIGRATAALSSAQYGQAIVSASRPLGSTGLAPAGITVGSGEPGCWYGGCQAGPGLGKVNCTALFGKSITAP